MTESSENNLLTFTLFWSARVDKIFPIDPAGDFTISYEKRQYKLRRQNLEYARLLYNFIKQDPELKSYEIKFDYPADPNAFEIIMQLLFGFKTVEIPLDYLIQVCSIVLSLGMNIYYCTC